MNINDTIQYTQFGLPEDIRRCKEAGFYSEAIRLIDCRLAEPGLTDAMKGSLLIQKRICQLLPTEFPYTKAEAMNIILEKIPDFTEEEFDELVDDRRIRWIYINGEMRFFNRFFSSVCKAIPAFALRAGVKLPGVESAVGGTQEDSRLDISMKKMIQEGEMSNRIRIRATVKLKDEHFTPGMFLRSHLPIPAACQQQSDIIIEKMTPGGIVAPEDAPQRSICWEEIMTDPYVAVLPKANTAPTGRISRETLAGKPFIMANDTKIAAYMEPCGIRDLIQITSHDDSSVVQMVKEGLGVSVLPSLSVRDTDGIVCAPLEPVFTRILGLVYTKKNFHENKNIRHFAEYIRTYVGKESPKPDKL